jgi:hypothetical protein
MYLNCPGIPLLLLLPLFKARTFTNGVDMLLSPVAHDVWSNSFVLTFSSVLGVRN